MVFRVIAKGGALLGTLEVIDSKVAMAQVRAQYREFNHIEWYDTNPTNEDREGICTRCGEHTTVEDSCCGVGVWVEGGMEFPEGDA